MTRVSLSKITNRKSCTVAIRSVFFWRSPVKPSASSLRMRSAPPGFREHTSVNSFDCPAFVPGRALIAFFVSFWLVIFSFLLRFGISCNVDPCANSVPFAAAVCSRTRQPFQGSQSRHEAVFPSAHGNELRQTVKTPADRVLGDSEKCLRPRPSRG
jgi:hypothetical protein